MIEVGGLAVLKIGGVTVAVVPNEHGPDRMSIVLQPGEEVLVDVLDSHGNRFGVLTLESDSRVEGRAYVSLSANGADQYLSTETPFPDHLITQSTIRGVEQRPPTPPARIREVLDAR